VLTAGIASQPTGLEQLDPNEKRQALQLLDAFIERGKLKKKAASG